MGLKKPDKDHHHETKPDAVHYVMDLHVRTLNGADSVKATIFTFRNQAEYESNLDPTTPPEDRHPTINQREFSWKVSTDFDGKVEKITPSEILKLIKEDEKDTFFSDATDA